MSNLWIGVPMIGVNDVTTKSTQPLELNKMQSKGEYEEEEYNLLDPTISRIGGEATYFRTNSSTCTNELLEYFKCPNCHSVNDVSLLAQLYAPLEYYDRVIYILMCSHCTRSQSRTSLQSAQSSLTNKHTASNNKGKTEKSASAKININNKMNSRQQEVARVLKQTTHLKSYVFAVRSQNFNKAYYLEEKRKEKLESDNLHTAANSENCNHEAGLMFSEANDWGDDDDEDDVDDDDGIAKENIKEHKYSYEGVNASKCKDFTDSNSSSKTQNKETMSKETVKEDVIVKTIDNFEKSARDTMMKETDDNTNHDHICNAGDSSTPQAFREQEELELEEFEVCHNNVGIALKGTKYTNGILLETFAVERDSLNENRLDKSRQYDMLERELERLGDVIDSTSYEIDEESAAEKCAREYVRTIEEIPSQCVRWCPGDNPLRSSVNPLPPVPCCALCGAQRQFELQLTAPIVYYLTKHMSEKDNHYIHFSNVFVYSCSAHCNSKNQPYCSEFTIVEDEL